MQKKHRTHILATNNWGKQPFDMGFCGDTMEHQGYHGDMLGCPQLQISYVGSQLHADGDAYQYLMGKNPLLPEDFDPSRGCFHWECCSPSPKDSDPSNHY